MTQTQFDKIVKQRSKKHIGDSFRYFWASFTMQIILYSFLCHFFIKHFNNGLIAISTSVLILASIPFTVVLMKKFKTLAVLKDSSINSYVQKQYDLINSFYRFKKGYELVLTPLMALSLTVLTFEIGVPGGVIENPTGAAISFVVGLLACIVAIIHENEKRFDKPLSNLRLILQDLSS